MIIKGPRVEIGPLRLEDVYEMRDWGEHENTLLKDYNFPAMTSNEVIKWFGLKTAGKNDKYYGIKNEDGFLIGYMGIKDIKKVRKSSTLGIVFDPDFIDKGYGTEALFTYLDFYFTRMNMRSMILEVNEFNVRARRVYEKLGFKKEAFYIDEFVDQELDLNGKDYLENQEYFTINKGKIYSGIYQMRVRSMDFLNIRDSIYQELIK